MTLKTLYDAPWFVKVVFVVSLFLVLFIAGLGYKQITDVSKSQRLVVDAYEVNIKLEQVLSYLKDAETGQRVFTVTKDSLYLDLLLNNKSKINNTFKELKEYTKYSNEQKINLEKLIDLVNNRIDNLLIIKNYEPNNKIQLRQLKSALLESRNYMNSVREMINRMITLEKTMLQKRLKTYETKIGFTPVFLFGLIVLMLLLIFLAYLKINNDLDKLGKKNRQLGIFKESTNQSEIINKHGSWRWNIDLDTFHFSDNLYRLLGEEPNSFKPTVANFMKFVHPEDIDKLSVQTEKMIKEKDLPFIYYRVIHKNGDIKYLKAYGKSITNTEGKIQLLGTTTDITDEIDNFNTLEKRNQELELNNKELQAFNYVASHDLQEPLRKIQTFLSRLKDSDSENFSDKSMKYMERIDISATRMRLLIDDLLQYSRTNKSDEVLIMSNINTLLENAEQDLAEVFVNENARIQKPHFPEMKVIPFQIQQLFMNLISNSLKYRSQEKEPVILITHENVSKNDRIELDSGFYENYHKITLKDNGIGFEQEYADKIFELFNRLHNRDDYTGTGIGLSICKKITDNHSGFIFADGVPNKGATFTVYLPIT